MAEEGNKTSEWKTWVVSIAGILATSIGGVLATGLIPEGSPWAVGLVIGGTVLAAIAGTTFVGAKYIGAREAVKVARANGGGGTG